MKTLAYPPPAPAARPFQPAAGQELSSGSLDAWRRVFEQEQSEALARFRSVPVGAQARAAEGGNARGAVRPVARRACACGMDAARLAPTRPEAGAAQYARGAGPAMSGTPSAALGAQVEAAVGIPAPPASPASEFAPSDSVAAAIDASLRAAWTDAGEAWPLRKMHLQIDENGVHVWLRDARLAANGAAQGANMEMLRQTLAQAGYRLAGYTLNGIRLI